MSYILQQHDTFQKSELVRFSLGTLTGRGMHGNPRCRSAFDMLDFSLSGLLFAEGMFLVWRSAELCLTHRSALGEQHKKQVIRTYMLFGQF